MVQSQQQPFEDWPASHSRPHNAALAIFPTPGPDRAFAIETHDAILRRGRLPYTNKSSSTPDDLGAVIYNPLAKTPTPNPEAEH